MTSVELLNSDRTKRVSQVSVFSIWRRTEEPVTVEVRAVGLGYFVVPRL